MGSTIILARLLTPEEFGLLAMVTAFTEFARSFRELGLGTATVQREHTTHEEVSNLFWINFAIGLAIMVILIGISPLIGRFYGDARLPRVCVVLSPVFLFGGLTVQHRALLERQMRFGLIGAINVFSMIIGICVAVVLAMHGAGVWALVFRDIVYAGLYASGTWLFCRWVPGLPRRNTGVKSSLRFGADVSGFDLIQYVTRNLDRMLIGRFCGAASLGLYTRALQLAMMPIDQFRMVFWDVGLPPLSALQSDSNGYRRFYSTLLSLMTFVYMPVIVFVAIRSEDVIRLLLGEAWLSAAPLLRILAFAAFFRPILDTFQLVMVSSGKTRRCILWGTVNGVCMITAFAIGIGWGTVGIAYGYVVATCVSLILSLGYCFKYTPVDSSLVLRSILLPIAASLGAGIMLIALSPWIVAGTSTPVGILFSVLTIAASYLAILLCIPNGRSKLAKFWSYRVDFFSRA